MGTFAECGRVLVKPLRSGLASSISGCSGFIRVASWRDARSVHTQVKPAFCPLRPKTGWPEVTNCPATSTNPSEFACWTHLRSDPVYVMSRRDRREDIFLDVDRQDFLKPLAEACQKAAWQVQARRASGSTQERPRQTGDRGSVALGDDASAQRHRGACAFGHVQERQRPPAPMDEPAVGDGT